MNWYHRESIGETRRKSQSKHSSNTSSLSLRALIHRFRCRNGTNCYHKSKSHSTCYDNPKPTPKSQHMNTFMDPTTTTVSHLLPSDAQFRFIPNHRREEHGRHTRNQDGIWDHHLNITDAIEFYRKQHKWHGYVRL